MNLPEEITLVLALLHAKGHEAFVVGGCVRDALMGNLPKDFDITTSALPHETCEAFADYKILETGLKHGTVTVIIHHIPIEITTYRIDGAYTDNRRPDAVFFTRSLREDLARRDFTMNALCFDPQEGFLDYFGGKQDIQAQLIRAVGNASLRFGEDALRILRALRFSAALGFSIEADTAQAIHQKKALLKHIAAERIAAEFNRILVAPHALPVLEEYLDVFAVFLPELLPMVGLEQNSPYHCFDVWKHTLVAIQSVEAKLPLRLAMLLHDIGKPSSDQEKAGVGHFYGHAQNSLLLARDILGRLKYDHATKTRVLLLIEYHDLPLASKRETVKRQLSKLGENVFFDLLKVKRADCLAQHPDFRDRLTDLVVLEDLAVSILSEKECFSLKHLAINGHDLIELGFPSGNVLGKTLAQLLEAVIRGECNNTHENLLLLANSLLRQEDWLIGDNSERH